MARFSLVFVSIIFLLSPLEASITVSSPNAGSSWCIGGTYPIDWSQSGSLEPNIDIRLRAAGSPESDPPALLIIDDTANDGNFSWTIPAAVAPGNYFIRVKTDTIVGDSAVFQIKSCASSISVSSPNGAEWKTGSTYPIHWAQSGLLEPNIDIRLRVAGSPDSNPPALAIADDTDNDGSFPWKIPASVAPGNYFIRVKTDTIIGDSVNFKISSGPTLVERKPPENLPPLLLKFPRLAVNEIDLTPNADGFGIIFSYKNVGAGALPKASEVPVKPNYRVLVDGRETASGSLVIPAFPAQPGWEQTGFFGGWIVLPSGSQGVGDYQFHVGNVIAVHINENKVMNMDSHSLTQNLKPIALKFGYDVILNSVHYDWDSNAVTMSVRIDGKIPLNKKLQFFCSGEFHDNVTLEPGRRLYSHKQKLVYRPSKSQQWIVLRLGANLVPFPVGNEKFMDIDMRNNFQERRFERPPRPAASNR